MNVRSSPGSGCTHILRPMDVLADVMEMTRTGPAVSMRIDVRSPWALRSPASLGAVFHVVLQGTCWLVRENGSPPLALGPGDAVLLPRGGRHALADDPRTPPIDVACLDGSTPLDMTALGGDGARALVLSGGYQLDCERPHPLLAALSDVIHVSADPGRHPSLRAAIAVLGEELGSDRPGASAVVSALIDALLPLIGRAWLDDRPVCPDGQWPEAFADSGMVGALERIHADPQRAWTVADLAREVGLSRAAFARRFTRTVGEPPLAYLARWRMTIAARLLRASDLKLAVVADRVGYQSEFAFAKAFKRGYGVAPGAYRRQVAA
jgi:AraC-like DNA-binding protein